jgi:hypothetical protein
MVVPDVYNESLIRRSEIVLDFDVIDIWNDELNKMNDGKEGVSYKYPDSFVQLLGSRVYFHLTYRQTEGVAIAYAGESVPDYNTVHKTVVKGIPHSKVKLCNNVFIGHNPPRLHLGR